jgi:hypothetical protein
MNIDVRRAICIVLLAVILGWYIYVYVTTPKLDETIRSRARKQTDVLDTLDNGDLILLSGGSHGEAICKWFCGSPFSHVGMVFREGNTLYFLECDLGQQRKSGVRVIPLKEKLARYQGQQVAGYKRLSAYNGSSKPSVSKIMEVINDTLHVKQDNLMLTWLFGNSSLSRSIKRDTHMFCSEFIAYVMIRLGIIEDKTPAYRYSPGDFDLSRLPYKNGYSYSTTEYFQREK